MNVLLTSAGRRITLLEAFRQAVADRGGRVFAGDRDGLAPALYLADEGFRLPSVDAPDYVPSLLELVERHRIRLVVPTIDPELPVLARAAPSFAQRNCKVLVSGEELVGLAADKWLSTRALGARGLAVPRSWLPEHAVAGVLPDRLFLKPRRGSGSQDALRVGRSELPAMLARVPDPIIQEELAGPEMTIDALLDFEGRPLHYVPRLRIRTVGGESIQGKTLPDADIRDWLLEVLRVLGSLGGEGPLTVQAFATAEGPVVSEINPRFGGGFPLTLAAGGRYPEWIVQMLEGAEVAPRIGQYQTGLYMTRYYRELFTGEPLW